MAKTANLYARIEPDVKEQAENILTALGIPVSNAINMFYKQIILQRGIPFEMKLPVKKPLAMGELTKEQLGSELAKGMADIENGRVYLAGRTKPAGQGFDEIQRDHSL